MTGGLRNFKTDKHGKMLLDMAWFGLWKLRFSRLKTSDNTPETPSA